MTDRRFAAIDCLSVAPALLNSQHDSTRQPIVPALRDLPVQCVLYVYKMNTSTGRQADESIQTYHH